MQCICVRKKAQQINRKCIRIKIYLNEKMRPELMTGTTDKMIYFLGSSADILTLPPRRSA